MFHMHEICPISFLSIIMWIVLSFCCLAIAVATEQAQLETNAPLPARETFSRQNILPQSKSFIFNVNCGTLSINDCKQAKAALEQVGNLIAHEILLRVPINIFASFSILNPKDNLYWSSYESTIPKPVIA